jgi:hypothetical protein
MSYESGFHDGRVETQLEAGKQMAKQTAKNQIVQVKQGNVNINTAKLIESQSIKYIYIPEKKETIIKYIKGKNESCIIDNKLQNLINEGWGK